MKSLVLGSKIFCVTFLWGGATIKTVSMVNYIVAVLNSNFSVINVFDCSDHCSNGGKNDASYIASLFFASP